MKGNIMKNDEFYSALKKLRLNYGLTQEEIGKILNVTKSQISLYEKGVSLPNTDLLTRITQYFDVPMTQLVKTPVRGNFYFREVVTVENVTIRIPTKDGVETLNGMPGLIKIPATSDLRDIKSHNLGLLKYANFMLLFPKKESVIASFFYEYFDELDCQKIEALFRYDEWIPDEKPNITYDGYPLLYQLLSVGEKGSWINSPLAKPATNANILALALPQNDEIIRLYIQPEEYGCKLHAKRCQGLDELILEWLVKSKKERQAIAREYCLQIMKAETEAEDEIETGYIQSDDDYSYLKPLFKKRGIKLIKNKLVKDDEKDV